MRRLIPLLLLLPALPVRAQSTACHEAAYRSWAVAQRTYQRQLVSLVSAQQPALRGTAELLRDAQIAAIEAREHVVLRLLREPPTRLRLERNVNEWLDWGAAERDSLVKVDPEYARLVERSRDYQGRIETADDLRSLQGLMDRLVKEAPGHQAALGRLNEAKAEATRRCR